MLDKVPNPFRSSRILVSVYPHLHIRSVFGHPCGHLYWHPIRRCTR